MVLSDAEVAKFQRLSRQEVLALPNKDKSKYLYALQIKHSQLQETGSDIMRLLNPYNETNILAVIGATGVGKTTLIKRVIKIMVEKAALEEDDPSAVPFIYISAPANGDKSISWKSIYLKAMKQGGDVLVNKKQLNVVKDGIMTVQSNRCDTLAALRDALDSMLEQRKVKVIVIDEAFHLLRFGEYSAVMDTLKSLVGADQPRLNLVLQGSFDLFDLVSEYGQVARRGEILHFDRYHKGNSSHDVEFCSIVERMQLYWPCEETPVFSSISEELMEASLGCIGLLKTIMLRSLDMQLENKGRWNPRFLAKAAKSLKLIERIKREIVAGEEKIKDAAYGESMFSGKKLNEVIIKMNQASAHA